jgi:thioredoxin-like negative regulator of GroEL
MYNRRPPSGVQKGLAIMNETGTREKPWHPSSPALQPETFDDGIEAPAVIVHFWAPWNPYDKQLDQNLQQVQAAGAAKRFRFYSVNTDQTAFEAIIERHHVAALPALLCFINGKVKGRFHGVETIEALKAFLDEMGQPGGR